ncbi:hypothetical protein A0256_16050 [Mucilaginibacter sp. PAMC 26640]|nr:hypothetical protein A0256_16050 [Mucilaginibacter sp. PAMC 26640]
MRCMSRLFQTSRMKIFFRNIHLYLSLAAGLVIFCSCLTGTILVFEKEINHLLYPQRYFVEAKGERLPLSALAQNALKQSPKAKLSSIMVYNEPERAVEINITLPDNKGQKGKSSNDGKETAKQLKAKDNDKSKKPGQGKKPSLTIYVNPYTGDVLGQFNKRKSFLNTVEMLHRFLLAGKDSFGNKIVGISTVIFLFILITGVILWWPKTLNIMRQRMKIKWGGSTKRLTHDLHIVFGFYTSVFLIVIVLTGLIMSFDWANKALYAITASEPSKDLEPPKSKYAAGLRSLPSDQALQAVAVPLKTAAYFTLRVPGDSAGIYTINIQPRGSAENTGDTYYIDQYSGKQLGVSSYQSKSFGQRVRALVKPVHTGSVFGLPTKILSFIVCLLSLIFPVTGVMMWLDRIKKKDKKVRKRRPLPVDKIVLAH